MKLDDFIATLKENIIAANDPRERMDAIRRANRVMNTIVGNQTLLPSNLSPFSPQEAAFARDELAKFLSRYR
jgi:hypothetical protein